MTKIDAIVYLVNDARREKRSTTSARRAVAATKALGLDAAETIRVMSWLDYCTEKGAPYSDKVQRVW